MSPRGNRTCPYRRVLAALLAPALLVPALFVPALLALATPALAAADVSTGAALPGATGEADFSEPGSGPLPAAEVVIAVVDPSLRGMPGQSLPPPDPEADSPLALAVTVVARGLEPGECAWRPLEGPFPHPAGVTQLPVAGARLCGPDGATVPWEAEPGCRPLTAVLAAPGDYTLTYTVDGPSAGQSLAPGALVLLPDVLRGPATAAVSLLVLPPERWHLLTNVPEVLPGGAQVDRELGGIRLVLDVVTLPHVRILLSPTEPHVLLEAPAPAEAAQNGQPPAPVAVLRVWVAPGPRESGPPVSEPEQPAQAGQPAQGEQATQVDEIRLALAKVAGLFASHATWVAAFHGSAGSSADTALPPGTAPLVVNVPLPPAGDDAGLFRDALDTLWLLTSAKPRDPVAARFVALGAWPLARAALLEQAGINDPHAGPVALAGAVCAEHRSYQETLPTPSPGPAPPAPPAIEAAPLVSACLLARAAGVGPSDFLGLVVSALQAGEEFLPGLKAALERARGPLAGDSLRLLESLATAGSLPRLPEDILAMGDPDADGDGLPDRLDPAPNVKGVSVTVDGRVVRWDVPPDLVRGRVMVPVRFLAETLGAEVTWDAIARQVVARYGSRVIVFPADSWSYTVNGRTYFSDAPARVSAGRTLVSLRFAAKALDVSVEWDAATLTAIVDRSLPYRDSYPPPVSGRLAYLTFDDGPHPSLTPRILDVLAAYEVKATFFVVGRAVARYPDIVRRIAAEGHALANHTYSHDLDPRSATWIYRSPEAYVAELDACDAEIAAVTGLHPVVTRPPGGSYPYLTQEFRDLLRDCGYVTYDWDVSAADSAVPRPAADQILARVVAGAREGRQSRLIILMHDGGSGHETTLEALPAVIEFLRHTGYSFAVLTG